MSFRVTCRNCGKIFEAKRSTARFHSSTCKVAYSRKRLDKADQVKEKVVKKTKTEEIQDMSKLSKNFLNALNALTKNRHSIIKQGFRGYFDIVHGGMIFKIYPKKLEICYGDMVVSYNLKGTEGADLKIGEAERDYKPYGSYLEGGYKPFIGNPKNPYIKSGGSVSSHKSGGKYRAFGSGVPF